ncbi:MAG: DUF6057 family protein [Parabacteroides sp.]|nr:DUF6057 family protein [Parabacteroides sp.]
MTDKDSLLRYISVALAVLMSLVFFGCFYSNHLLIREGLQLFLFTPEYFVSYLDKPSWLSLYSSGFVTQFFVSGFGSAFLLTLLFFVEWQVAAKIVRKVVDIPNVEFYVFFLSASEVIRYLSLQFSLDLTFSMIYSLLVALMAVSIRDTAHRNLFSCMAIPVLYYLTGLGVCVFTITVVVVGFVRGKLDLPVCLFFLVFVSVLEFAFGGLFDGFVFYDWLPVLTWLAVLAVLLLVPRYKPYMGMREPLVVYFLFLLYAVIGVSVRADFRTENILDAGRAVQDKDWEKVQECYDDAGTDKAVLEYFRNIALLNKETPPDSLLKMKVDPESFFLKNVESGPLYNIFSNEIYWQLGDYNMAELAGMRSLSDFKDNGSVRIIRRLAEISFATSDTALFEKYASILSRTMVYRGWAGGLKKDFYSKVDTVELHNETDLFLTVPSFRNADDGLSLMKPLLEYGNKKAFDCLAYSFLYNRNLQELSYICEKYGKFFYGGNLPEIYAEAMALNDYLDNYDNRQSYGRKKKKDSRYNNILRFMELYKGKDADAELLCKEFSGSYLGYYFDIEAIQVTRDLKIEN